MTSRTTKQFRALFAALPKEIQSAARKAFQQWRANPRHPSVRFKPVNESGRIYSARVTRDYRALGVKSTQAVVWFWIGSHDEYERIIS